MTTKVTTIYQKLLEAKKQFGSIQRKKEGYGYKYADIATVCDAIDEHLEDNGLGYFHRSGYEQIGETIIEYISFVVFDQDGELELSRKAFQGYNGNKSVYQDMGAASTYLRRYTMLEGFGLAVEDDDAASLTKKPVKQVEDSPEKKKREQLLEVMKALPKDIQDKAGEARNDAFKGAKKLGEMTMDEMLIMEEILSRFVDLSTGELKEVK